MKKIRLNVANLDSTEVLSRNQLKSIFGGSGSGSGSGSSSNCTMHCKDGTVIYVSKCSDTSKCNSHGGAQNCNGRASLPCLTA